MASRDTQVSSSVRAISEAIYVYLLPTTNKTTDMGLNAQERRPVSGRVVIILPGDRLFLSLRGICYTYFLLTPNFERRPQQSWGQYMCDR